MKPRTLILIAAAVIVAGLLLGSWLDISPLMWGYGGPQR